MQDLWKIVVLGIIEGFTEFLPISSTGHLLIASDLIGFQPAMGATFDIFIQLGATLAVVAFFAKDLWGQAKAVTHDRDVQRLWLNIAIAFVPAAAVGFLFHKQIKVLFYDAPSIIAWAMIIGGIIMILVEWWLKGRTARTQDAEHLTWGQALGTGVAQILALIPGVSRSGSTIVGGMVAGVSRQAATRFSFYLAIPTMIMATLYDLATSVSGLTTTDMLQLLVGLVVSFIFAWIAIGWLLRFVANHTLVPFGIYRIVVGALILFMVFAGRL